MVNSNNNEQASIFWPTLISTAKFSVSLTVQISKASASTGNPPADGFTLLLADPSAGATSTSVGVVGNGIGAAGIPGFVLAFDTYQDGNLATNSSCTYPYTYNSVTYDTSCDPTYVPYLGVGRGEPKMWETPWSYVNGHLIGTYNSDSTYDFYGELDNYANSTHDYVVSVESSVMTVTMDGNEVFSGSVTLPPSAYLGFTASTGGANETVILSNLTATISAP